MKKLTLLAATFALAALAAPAHATKEDAQGLLKAALAEIKAKGLDAASASITAGGPWAKGTTYVFVADTQTVKILGHAVNNKLIGKSLIDVKDANGKPFVQEQLALVKKDGSGAVTMRWMNPVTKQLGDAEALVSRVPGADAYVGAVYFK